MTRTQDTTVVTVVRPICCGLDIHKEFVTVCLITTDPVGKERSVLECFGTFTDDLVRLREWLLDHECPVVALERAGKRRSTRSPVRGNHLRTHLVEAAWGAVKKKATYLRSKYFSLKSRLGPKKAIMAIAHRILKALYYIIKHGASFRDLGEDYLVELRSQSITLYLARQAKKLGMVLISEPLRNQMIDRSPA